MAKKKNQGLVLILVLIIAFVVAKNSGFLGAVIGTETVTRMPTGEFKLAPNALINLNYTINNANNPGEYTVDVRDTITGDCIFTETNSNTFLKTVNQDVARFSMQLQAPATSGVNCSIAGSYLFIGAENAVSLSPLKIVVCSSSCTRPTDDNCKDASTVPDVGCGGYCTGSWEVTRLTSADVNCDNSITRSELTVAVNYYNSGTIDRTDLGKAIQSWSVSA